MATLSTVQNYIDRARVLLLDQDGPDYRYPDTDLVAALNEAILETRRLRPDLMLAYFRADLPEYSTASLSATVDIDPMYRNAFVYYIAGQAQLRDSEDTTDARASSFLGRFQQILTAI
jgi:hypothetical protein